MRITNNMLTRDSLAHIQAQLRPISQAQAQVSTGLRIQKSSDDPAAAAGVMRAGGSIRALDQYRRNIGAATSRVDAEEAVLNQLTDVLTRARELGISQNTSLADPLANDATLAEVDTLLGFVSDLANTRHGDEYLFGGTASGQPPVPDPANPLAQPLPTGSRKAEVSAGRYVDSTHDAASVFGSSGALAALGQLKTALQTRDRAGIAASLGSLDGAFGEVQSLLGETGARSNQLQVTHANLDALEVTLRTFKSDLEEVDLEKAMTELVSRQTAYQAAMLATSKVLSLNLSDYLR
jgi:flagellar hook-associated protein 3 FlgL